MRRLEARERDALWVESSRHKEAARALEMLHVQLISAVIDPYSWKWVIVAAHHALQAFLLSALEGGDAPGETIPLEIEGGWLRVERGTESQAPHSGDDPLLDLYARVKKSTGLVVLPEVDRRIAGIAASRNVFLQNMPLRWELGVRDLPETLRSGLRVIESLGWNPGHIRWEKAHLSDLARVKYLASLKVLEALERQYQSA